VKGLATLSALLERFSEAFGGSGEIYFARAPGRLNPLGMHIDHRGAFVNPMAIQKEILLCFRGRRDDIIQVQNASPDYGPRTFSISEELPKQRLSDVEAWLYWTQELASERISAGTNTDWVNKLKSVPVYLGAILLPEERLRGFDGVLEGNLPPRIGLSSSSAIVVAMMETLSLINDLKIETERYAYHCGVAEWYVGMRGGFGDHAAIKFARAGTILRVKTTPELVIAGHLPFPQGCSTLVFDSGVEADKTGAAGQKFNEKTATYEFGEMYIRKYLERNHPDVYKKISMMRRNLPEGAKKVHLADLVEYLPEGDIYALLSELPRKADREMLLADFPEEQDLLQRQFATHREPPEGYSIQSVIIYRLAESKRALMLSEVLKAGDAKRFGQLMNASHDGDRVEGVSEEVRFLKVSIKPDLPLHLQIGDYNCSIGEVDRMVDIALSHGALGAQICGAGMGGSMMALVETEKAERVIRAMREEYFEPMGIKENFLAAIPVGGACIL